MYSDYYNMYNSYCKGYKNNYRSSNSSDMEEIITLNEAINLIKKSVGDEKEDEMFYSVLIEQAPTEKEKIL